MDSTPTTFFVHPKPRHSSYILGSTSSGAVLPHFCTPLLLNCICAAYHLIQQQHAPSPLLCLTPQLQINESTAIFCTLPAAVPPHHPSPLTSQHSVKPLGPLLKGVDKRGRPVLYQGGRMTCNNFNDLGYTVTSCRFLHTYCSGAHFRPTYPHNLIKHNQCKYLSTPFNINPLAGALQNHLDQFNFLIQGFTYDFHPGLQCMPNSSSVCYNLQSAISKPDTVDKLLDKEAKELFQSTLSHIQNQSTWRSY